MWRNVPTVLAGGARQAGVFRDARLEAAQGNCGEGEHDARSDPHGHRRLGEHERASGSRRGGRTAVSTNP